MKKSLSILLIEDDAVDEMAMLGLAKKDKLPYQFDVARTVAEARRKIQTGAHDLIIADYQLPDGTAFDFFDLIHGKLVIFATGSGDEETAARALRMGVRDYLIKDPERKYLKLLPHRVEIILRQWAAERQLRESEQRYRELIEGTADLVQSVSAEGKILFANRAWRDTLGYTEAELSGLDLFQIIAPDWREDCGGLFQRLMQGEEVGVVEVVFRAKDGRNVELEGDVNVRFEDGKAVSTRGIFRDVSARKRAEAALQDSRARLDLALSSAGMGTWHWDIVADHRTFDEQVCRLLGIDPLTFTGTAESFFQVVHPDDVPAIKTALARTLQADAPYESTYRVVRSDGTTRHLAGRGKLVRDEAGRPLRIDGILWDITAPKQAETVLRENTQRLTKMFLAAPAATSLSDLRTGEFIDVNDRFVELAGRSREELIGRSSTTIGLWKNRSDRERLEAMAAREGRIEREESVLVMPDGRTKDVGISVSLVEVGGRRCALSSLADITARKEAERGLREREALLSSINANLAGTCVYRMIHGPGGRMDCVYVSPNVEELIGVPSAQFLADSTAVFRLVHPEDVPVLRQGLADALRTGGSTSIVVRMLHASGGERWMKFRSQLVERRPDGTQVRDGVVVDVTSVKAAEAELKALHQRLEMALHASRACTWEDEVAANRLTLDPAWTGMLGYPPRETVTTSRALIAIAHPEDRAAIIAAARSAIRGETDDYRVEHRVATAQGGWIWIMSHGRVVARDAAGKALRIVGTNTDITARKQAEEEVRHMNTRLERLVAERTASLTRSENQLRLVWEKALDGMRITDEGGTVLRVNEAYCRLMGRPRTALEGQPMNAPYADERRNEILEKHRLRFRKRSIPPLLETTVTLRDGRKLQLELANAFIASPGEPELLLLSVFRDITQRKLAETALREREELFRGVFDASPIPIFLSTVSEGRLIEVNATGLETFGYTREEVIGRTTGELGVWVRPEQQAEYFRRILADRSVRGFEVILRTKPGVERLMLFDGAMIVIAGRTCVLTAGVDITAVRQAEAEKTGLQERLYQNQKYEALGTLAGGVAHDFNNILTGVINYTSLAKEDCPPTHPRIKEFLDEVLGCGNRAKDLVRQILLFSRAEEGRQEPAQLQTIVREALALLRSTLPATAIIDTEIDSQAPVILANPTQLHQVIMNLGINASHALKGEPGQITMRLQKYLVDDSAPPELSDLQPGPHVRLEVADTGCGMDEAVLARIFEPFFTTKPVGEGTGLGLAVVHSIIRSHRGAITVRSRPGAGTTFEVFIPVHASIAAPTASVMADLPRGRGEHILLVDDEETIASSVKLLLERLGYRISVFTAPDQALVAFEKSPDDFNAVLVDYQMPGMTGVVLASRFLARRPGLPVLVASGFTGSHTAESLQEVGIAGLLHKPIELEHLAVALARVLAPLRA